MHTPSPQDDSSDYLRLITAHQGALYAFILTVHPDRAAAQDILQETSIVLWEKRERFEAGTNFKAWAFRFAYLQTLAYRKRELRMPALPLDDALLETLAQEVGEQLDQFEERRGALKACIEALPKDELQVVRAHYEDERSLSEMADWLGRSRDALKQGLWRTRQALRACIERTLRQRRTT